MRRPTSVVDRLSEKPGVLAASTLDAAPAHDDFQPLPNPGSQRQALFGFDLRRGMGRDVVGQLRHWDPVASVNLEWTPVQDRDGHAVAAPQRYRFWVTAVDAFEQESAPVPVRTDDPDVGGAANYLFSPLLRAPLLPPPGPETSSVFALSRIDNKLRMQFESPLVNSVGRSSDPGSTAIPSGTR